MAFNRHTTLAAALINAAVKVNHHTPLDLNTGSGPWVARRVAINATKRGRFGLVREWDVRPNNKQQDFRGSVKVRAE
jgi:hypothetical protein